MRILLLIVVAAASALAFSQITSEVGDWPVYGHDPAGSRHSPLAQINTTNVSHLERAWTYHTGEKGRSFEVTPIFVDNVLYFSTQNQSIVALDPETGREIWKYVNPKPIGAESRGVAYWPGDKKDPPRIVFGTGDGRLLELDAKTGSPAATFGTGGSIDLRIGVADKYPNAHFSISSPPVIYRDVVIVGPSTQESGSVGPDGDPRGFDVRTGKLLWSFHTVPRPGEPGNDSWGTNGWKDRAGPSQWGLDTVDTERGLVFLPVGNAADSFYGGDREGPDLYANSVVALDALTGKLRWYYQMVHHDLWDYDMNAPPALIDVKHDGELIPALAETNKMGLLFILDRRTGKPIYGVEERPVPKGDTPGEWYSPTEPFPLKPPPLSRMTMTMSDVSKRTPQAEKFCAEWFGRLRSQGAYTPFGSTASLAMPGTMGGGNWGGVSFDPELGYIFVNTSSLGTVGQMVPADAGSALPYHNLGGYTRFIDQEGYPCQQPPWGELIAVNANTGDIVWRKPLGSYDELEALGMKDTGAPNIGGSIVTAGGLVFIAATTDSKFRAFDSRTGAVLWMTKLDSSGTTVPMTYLGRDGRQYVVVAAGGTNRFRMIANTADKNADALIAFALPSPQESRVGAQAAAKNPSSPNGATASAVISARTGSSGVVANAANAAALPEGEGKAIVLSVCTKCHGTANFSTLHMSRTGWEDEVEDMKGKGAIGTQDDFNKIIDYLAKNFPPRQ
jgi:glucose dehydrogenase/cytochrome c5